MSCYNNVYKNLNNKISIDIIAFDFAKAFDKVNAYPLLDKISKLGASNSFVSLLEVMLTNRYQVVSLCGVNQTLPV